MTFNEPEVVEMGLAEDLIREDANIENSESTVPPKKTRSEVAIYISEE
jgi:hypothetical protein